MSKALLKSRYITSEDPLPLIHKASYSVRENNQIGLTRFVLNKFTLAVFYHLIILQVLRNSLMICLRVFWDMEIRLAVLPGSGSVKHRRYICLLQSSSTSLLVQTLQVPMVARLNFTTLLR